MHELQQLWPFLAMGVLVGSVAEWAAYRLSLWQYRSPFFLALNVLGMFGGVMGWVAGLQLSWEPKGMIASLIGTLYELLNMYVLQVWTFPGQKLGPVRGGICISLTLGLVWACVPLIICSTLNSLGYGC